MNSSTTHQFPISPEDEPSGMRRFMRRTIYLRLLDGEFVVWCYETGLAASRKSELLRHPRVVISDTQAFKPELIKALNEIHVGSAPWRRRILVVHCLRFLPGELPPAEVQELSRMWRPFGRELFMLPRNQKPDLTDTTIAAACAELGALRRRLTKMGSK